MLKQDHVEPAFLVAWRSQRAPKDTPKDRKSDARPALKHQLDTQKGARTLHKTQGVPKRTPRTHKIIKHFLVRNKFNAKYVKRSPRNPEHSGNDPSRVLRKDPWAPKKQQIETEYTFGPLAQPPEKTTILNFLALTPPPEKRSPTELFGPDPTTGED